MANFGISEHLLETPRHRTAWLEAGPTDGPLMIFIHGWPELSLVWRSQLDHFAGLGWRCVAPDMRGYGGSAVPDATAAYAVRELVGDMVELHDALGAAPAVWVGHDWGSAVAWSMASHHPARCAGVVNLCIPYLARGLGLPNLVPLVDRDLYPESLFPVGQWDYWLFYREHFGRASREFEADVEAAMAVLYRTAAPLDVATPSFSAGIRAAGGWFGDARRAPAITRDEAMLSRTDFETIVAAFRRTGFAGANAWYMNDPANLAFAAEAPAFGRLSIPALFFHAKRDMVCDTLRSRLADPMREDCAYLTEVTIDAGHELMLERPGEVNTALQNWLASCGPPATSS